MRCRSRTNAARTYRKLGFKWEDGFLEGSAQKKLRQYLDKRLASL